MALRISTEMVEALRYKLRTFGVNLEGPEEVYCEEKLVVKKSSVPASVLNKSHNAVVNRSRCRRSSVDKKGDDGLRDRG